MPLAVIQIRQEAPDRWHADLETGGMANRIGNYKAASLPLLLIDIEDGYYALSGEVRPGKMKIDDDASAAAKMDAFFAESARPKPVAAPQLAPGARGAYVLDSAPRAAINQTPLQPGRTGR